MDFRIIRQGILSLFIFTVALVGQQSTAIAESIFPPLQQWNFDGDRQILSLIVHQTALPHYFVLREPDRVVLDILDTSWPAGTVTQPASGNVSQIRISQFQEGTTRFVLNWIGQTPPPKEFQLLSFPQNDGSVLWQLNLGTTAIASNPMTPAQSGKREQTTFPPALLPPPVRSSVTIAPPPIPSNIRK